MSETPFICMALKLVSMKQNTNKEHFDSKMCTGSCVPSVHCGSKMLYLNLTFESNIPNLMTYRCQTRLAEAADRTSITTDYHIDL
jgi:hypothetical protein